MYDSVFLAIRDGNVNEVARALDKDKGLLKATDKMGRILLMEAVIANQYEICKLLIARGADVNVRDKGLVPGCLLSSRVRFLTNAQSEKVLVAGPEQKLSCNRDADKKKQPEVRSFKIIDDKSKDPYGKCGRDNGYHKVHVHMAVEAEGAIDPACWIDGNPSYGVTGAQKHG